MIKKTIKNILLCITLLITFYAITYFINSNITIRALYKDDLASWSWFPGLSFYDFAIKFYNSTRYRPVFYALEYIEYYLVGTNVIWFTYINVFLNSLLATFVFFFAKKNVKSIALAFFISLCYIISHFSYYQITQVIGILETYSQLFALIILYLSISYIENNKLDIIKLISIYILYFLVVFTHERYMFLAVPILFTIIYKAKKDKVKSNVLYRQVFIFIIEIAIIVLIRILATGKFIPSGTGGTEVNETFNLIEAINFAVSQVLFIFGLNIGPEHLVGMPFNDTPLIIKVILSISILALLTIIIIYIVLKINNIKKYKKNTENIINYLYKDILYILFIALAIGSSSVTIRVEMRFVYASFTASMLYLADIIGYIKDNYTSTNNKYNLKDNLSKIAFSNKIIILTLTLFFVFFFARSYVEFKYRKSYPKIHCVTDLLRVNSLADQTIYKYGIDELKNKNIYILYNYYEFTDFYCEWFYKIFDKTNEGLTINIIKDLNDIPKNLVKDKDLIFIEDIVNFGYTDITDQFIK